MIHNVDIDKTENVLLVVINFSTDSVYLLKGVIMGFMQDQSLIVTKNLYRTLTHFVGGG